MGHGRSILSTWAVAGSTYNHGSSTKVPIDPAIWGFKLSQSTDRVFDNGVLDVTVANPGSYTGGCDLFNVQVGLGMSTTPGSGTTTLELAEVMVYDRDLSTEELNQLGCYARDRYAIPGYLGTCN